MLESTLAGVAADVDAEGRAVSGARRRRSGLIFGVVPGIGGTTAIALLMPLTFGMDPDHAMMLMGGIMGAVSAGGSITVDPDQHAGRRAERRNLLRWLSDGAAGQGRRRDRRGRHGASTLGGLIGVIVLMAVIPMLKQIVLLFGPPEYLHAGTDGPGVGGVCDRRTVPARADRWRYRADAVVRGLRARSPAMSVSRWVPTICGTASRWCRR